MKKRILYIIITLVVSTLLVIGLFLSSEHIMKKENPFVRRFLPHPIDKAEYLDLGVNSYYIAGLTQDTIYLGNYTAPLLVTAFNVDNFNLKEHLIRIDQPSNKFKNINVRILNDLLHVSDGTVPIVYKGSTTNWKVYKNNSKHYFSIIEPVDSQKDILRSQLATNGELVLGQINDTLKDKIDIYNNALKKQIDGVFDSDGFLTVDRRTKQAIYTYYYRNQYIVLDNESIRFKTGKTIDTTTYAKIQVIKLTDGSIKMSAPPHKVNARTYAFNGLLYIKSELLGKNEPKSMWNQASIIDVYDYNKNEYLYSFYAYDHQKEKIREFAITDDYFFGLVGNSLVRYEMMEGTVNSEQRTENREQ